MLRKLETILGVTFLSYSVYLDGDLCTKISFISIFLLFFWFSNMILREALILAVSQLQTQQVIASQIRSHRIINADLFSLN